MAEDVAKKRIVLGITGSIAAYKSAKLARLFVGRGHQVKVVMSKSAEKFITTHTMKAVTGNPVVTSFWEENMPGSVGHIELADWADVVVVAPATAECLAKSVAGNADDPLSAILLATRAPIVFAPAMNVNMLEHPATRANIATLEKRGCHIVEPAEGDLACGYHGRGRLAPPWEIFYQTLAQISERDFAGSKVLISAGPTREPLDPIRFISNRSSGKMGVALAREAYRRGAEVTLVHGPVNVKVPKGVRCIPVVTAREMHQTVMAESFPDDGRGPDAVIMAAAVADFRPDSVQDTKIKKEEVKGDHTLQLAENPDILASLGERRGAEERPILVGFAVETGEVEELLEELQRKLEVKKVDMIVGNLAVDSIDLDTNRVWMIDRHGKSRETSMTFKSRVASKILDRVAKL